MSVARQPTEQALLSTNRKAWREYERQRLRAQDAQRIADEAKADLELAWKAACARFGRDVPRDALVLDVLELVEVVDGDRWLWHGIRNNKRLPVVRMGRSEQSACRFFAIEFGVIDNEWSGTLYPVDGDVDDINPFHRSLRASERPTGNPNRYALDA